jgi:hypothetical protein
VELQGKDPGERLTRGIREGGLAGLPQADQHRDGGLQTAVREEPDREQAEGLRDCRRGGSRTEGLHQRRGAGPGDLLPHLRPELLVSGGDGGGQDVIEQIEGVALIHHGGDDDELQIRGRLGSPENPLQAGQAVGMPAREDAVGGLETILRGTSAVLEELQEFLHLRIRSRHILRH